MFNDLLSHRFLSLCFTKNSTWQKTLIHLNQNAAELILVLLDFFCTQSFQAKDVDLFIQAGSLVSRGTNFQHHWWTHSLFSLPPFRRSGTKQKQKLDFPRGQTFYFEQLFSSHRNCSLQTSQGSCSIKSGRDFNEVCKGLVTGRVCQTTAGIDRKWLSSIMWWTETHTQIQIRKESGGGFLGWNWSFGW